MTLTRENMVAVVWEGYDGGWWWYVAGRFGAGTRDEREVVVAPVGARVARRVTAERLAERWVGEHVGWEFDPWEWPRRPKSVERR